MISWLIYILLLEEEFKAQHNLSHFQDFYGVEHQKILKHVCTHRLSITRYLECLLGNWTALKDYFKTQSQAPVLLLQQLLLAPIHWRKLTEFSASSAHQWVNCTVTFLSMPRKVLKMCCWIYNRMSPKCMFWEGSCLLWSVIFWWGFASHVLWLWNQSLKSIQPESW